MKLNQIINGDALEELKKLPDNSIDLIVTDPPYGIDYQSAWRTDKDRFNKIIGDKEINANFIDECFRTLKKNSAFYMFTRWDVYPEWNNKVISFGFKIKSVIIWDRVVHGLGDLRGAYSPCYDICIFAVKGRHILNGKRSKDVIRCKRVDPDKLLHPTQKPLELIIKLIGKSSNENDIILDPFLGSGTTAIAAKMLNRNYIGIEINPEYCKIAEERLKNVPDKKLTEWFK